MSRILTAALLTIALSSPALAGTVPEGVTLRAYEPVGNGDPDAISCWAGRVTPPIRGLHCARNAEWARINRGRLRGVWGYTGDWASNLDPRRMGMPSGDVPSPAAVHVDNPFEAPH
jgi:hypothetical protein